MSSGLKLARDVERGSDGGTDARDDDGDTFDGGDVCCVTSLSDDEDDDELRRTLRWSGELSAMRHRASGDPWAEDVRSDR
jgi:hypothetical protein